MDAGAGKFVNVLRQPLGEDCRHERLCGRRRRYWTVVSLEMRCECLFSLDWWCVRRTAANARADAASATSGSIVPADAPFVSILAIPEPEVSKLPSSRQAICGFRSEATTSELQSLMRLSYAVFC